MRTNRALLATLAGALAVTMLSACAGSQTQKNGTDGADTRYVAGDGSAKVLSVEERKAAPRIAGTTVRGKHVDLADYRGKVVVANFWASWCAPCRAEAPTLEALAEKHKADGVRFVGVNIKDDKAAAKAFERNFTLSYPSLFDPSGKIALAFRETVPPQAIPSTIVIDKQGRVSGRVIGSTSYSGLNKLIDSVVTAK